MKIIGDVNGKNVIILDDMVDTAGTITKAADIMIDGGAISVRAFASPVLSDPATERIKKSKLTEIYFTDSIPLHDTSCDKIKILSVADLIADTIIKVNTNESISSSFLI